MKTARVLGRLFAGLILGALTVGLISFCATKLPYSPIRDQITDAASVPATLIAQIVYPEGVHTGKGAPRWGLVFLCAGVLFYTVVWFGILSLPFSIRSRSKAGNA
jgi:hypothetical protein